MKVLSSPTGPASTGHSVPARRVRRTVLVTLSAAGLLTGVTGVAQAATGSTSTQSTTANVQVGSAIVLSALTPAFTLIGNPGDTVTTGGNGQAPAVAYRVTTNNQAGYTVTVQPTAVNMPGNRVANATVIPVSDLTVFDSAGVYAPLDYANAVLIHTQAGPSVNAGDQLSNNYQMTIPFVEDDTYTASLTYVATAL